MVGRELEIKTFLFQKIKNFIADMRQLNVFHAQSLHIVCGPSDGDFVVNIAPFGVVIVFFGSNGYLLH